ncbi:hypothetical protein L1987_17984 [Smallanthus sonchifolius]|uniref:Uncharacterized protein n=1 Tax=Smallanthus sonchifolius TaxID=185202 RepID=A0ACB9IYA9_9ASTR|nr:hypothetical protein L1987_17984 [Smallanthus sonchifolius]
MSWQGVDFTFSSWLVDLDTSEYHQTDLCLMSVDFKVDEDEKFLIESFQSLPETDGIVASPFSYQLKSMQQ